jgi:hypothetical protein
MRDRICQQRTPGHSSLFARGEIAGNDRVGVVISEGSIMSTWLDLLYREYCRARLAEMRKQLLLSATNDEIPAANRGASDPAGPDDSGRSLSDDTATRKPLPPGSWVL